MVLLDQRKFGPAASLLSEVSALLSPVIGAPIKEPRQASISCRCTTWRAGSRRFSRSSADAPRHRHAPPSRRRRPRQQPPTEAPHRRGGGGRRAPPARRSPHAGGCRGVPLQPGLLGARDARLHGAPRAPPREGPGAPGNAPMRSAPLRSGCSARGAFSADFDEGTAPSHATLISAIHALLLRDAPGDAGRV